MTRLIVPLICKCGFNTMDAKAAIKHLDDCHPEEPFVEDEEGDTND